MNSDKFNQSEIIPGTNCPTRISTSISTVMERLQMVNESTNSEDPGSLEKETV